MLRVTKEGGVVLIGTEEGYAFEIVEDPNVEDKSSRLYRHMPGSKTGEVFKKINIQKELYDKGIAGIPKEHIGRDMIIMYIHKSKGDDERAKKLPFKFFRAAVLRAIDDDPLFTSTTGHINSFYKRELLKK